MDTQTQPQRPTKPQNGRSGSKLRAEDFEEKYSLDEIVPALDCLDRGKFGELTDVSFRAAMNVLVTRKEILYRLRNCEIEEGKILRMLGEIEKVKETFEKKALTQGQRLDLEGRRRIAEANIALSREVIKQNKLEIMVIYEALQDRDREV